MNHPNRPRAMQRLLTSIGHVLPARRYPNRGGILPPARPPRSAIQHFARPEGLAQPFARRLALIRATPQRGAATAEYLIATMAAVGFAGLLVIILKSEQVRGMLTDLVQKALSAGG